MFYSENIETLGVVDRFRKMADSVALGSHREDKYNQYYDNRATVANLNVSAPANVRMFETSVNWCRLVVDSIANRMNVQGFVTSLGDAVNEQLWDWWQYADMDKESHLAHIEALVQGRAYIITNWAPDSDFPEWAVATSETVRVQYDPRTRKVVRAIQVYRGDDEVDLEARYGALYELDATYHLERAAGTDWVVVDVEEHNLGIVPVTPMVNRARISDRYGRSEIEDIIPISDFATRLMTNAQVAQEFLAIPQRYAIGVAREDFQDGDGQMTSAWKAYTGAYVALENAEAKLGQLPGADLRNFTEMFNMLARQVASLSSLPPHAVGIVSSNPVSADAIRAGEAPLVQRIMDRCSAFEQAWEEAMRIALVWSGREDARQMRIETNWANPETPTYSAKADAVTKLKQAGIYSVAVSLEEMGFSPEKIEQTLQHLREEQEMSLGIPYPQMIGPDDTEPVREGAQRDPSALPGPGGTPSTRPAG